MRNILMLLLISTTPMFSQSLPELIKAYEEDCETIIQDTITIYGYECYSYRWSFFEQSQNDTETVKDTVWVVPSRRDLEKITGTIDIGGAYIDLDPLYNKFNYDIIKDTIIDLKKCEPRPWSKEFWEFCKNYNNE